MRRLPDWVLRDENYSPDGERDYFISRSLLRIMRTLRALRYRSRGERLRYFSAAGAILFAVAVILLCVMSRTTIFLLSVTALELVLMCLLDGALIVRILRNSAAAALFGAMFVLPAFFLGDRNSLIILPGKIFLTATVLGLLTTFFRWHDLTAALKIFRVPSVVIFILDTTLRYIVLLGELAQDLLTALKLRSVGRNRRKQRAITGVLGVVFLKSREMSDEMYMAMVCRGFTGEYVSSRKILRAGDAALLMAAAMLAGLFVVSEGVWQR